MQVLPLSGSPIDCFELFAGEGAITRSFLRRGMAAHALDIAHDSRDAVALTHGFRNGGHLFGLLGSTGSQTPACN